MGEGEGGGGFPRELKAIVTGVSTEENQTLEVSVSVCVCGGRGGVGGGWGCE